jgi:hypothetical protein
VRVASAVCVGVPPVPPDEVSTAVVTCVWLPVPPVPAACV